MVNMMERLLLTALTAFILAFLGARYYTVEKKAVQAPHQQQAKITVRLSDGKKMIPIKAYVRQDHVQLIMPDGRAIIMAWNQIDVIIYK